VALSESTNHIAPGLRANRKLTRRPRSAVLSFRIADYTAAVSVVRRFIGNRPHPPKVAVILDFSGLYGSVPKAEFNVPK
jgi:hypothetical protein